ncbi:MAG: peptidoglycan recognition family protein [Lutimonas sp.]
MRFILSVVAALLFFSCKSIEITDKPIRFDQERIDLSLQYLDEHYDLKQLSPLIKPKMVVVHWTAIPTLDESFDAFEESKLPNSRPEILGAGELNVSSQFLVDQDGTVYRLMPEDYMARHVIGLNHCAIGIENVGGTEGKPLTKAQLKSNIQLITYLKEKYPAIDYVIGHYEYTLFENHPLWLEKDAGYRTEKTDPGEDFITSIREATKKYNWQPIPSVN